MERVVERRLVERLVLGVGADIAEHELIAVGRRLGDAVRAGHAARAADILHDDRLVKLRAQAFGDDPGDGVRRAAGRKGRDHGQRPVRPVLGVYRRRERREACQRAQKCACDLCYDRGSGTRVKRCHDHHFRRTDCSEAMHARER